MLLYRSPLTCLDEDVLSVLLTSEEDRRFHRLLIAMCFIDNSPSSVAVQQALYALIALYIYERTRSMQYKVNAITALNHSFRSSLNAKDGLQHIAAGLLLSLYEILDSYESSYQWELYACGAKRVGNQIYPLDQVYQGDASVILNWLFYHDALFTFTACHWRPEAYVEECVRDDQIRRAVLLSGNTSKVLRAEIIFQRI